mmetsp:Transcript_32799/g.45551  ORF Transcript_32799/g.45551 Transcript_32799/m.45551 type:complete len:131 (+) Transcript_32799:494-886(+)|eukprot:CAMPEP_0196574846 /NCGR_PEP_ID=MMETSP1081-20130531/4468_1 /TAXON_ID=36882 /ORGANISM="Pyramimonas amylifera, Strain CCMP720" /LENGTH=130 /DNA_ID=CAMNT_0041892979 /DNA_START=490 /DNA_END=882 /DNA_ORIENTATION=+
MATQLHVAGFLGDKDQTDIDEVLTLAGLREGDGWCGPGTSVVKRDAQGALRGFIFASFLSQEAASAAALLLNAHGLVAEPIRKRPSSAKPTSVDTAANDLRIRRKRLPSKPKHPESTTCSKTGKTRVKPD